MSQPARAQHQAQAAVGAVRRQIDIADGRMKAKDYSGAISAYQNALQIDPSASEAYYKLGYAHALGGHLDLAVQAWEQVLRLDPTNEGAKKNLEVAKKKLASQAPAASPPPAAAAPSPPAYAAAAPRAPSRAELRQSRIAYEDGVKLIGQRSYEQAVAALKSSIEADPSLSVAHVALGSALVGLRRYEEAVAEYERALALNQQLASPLFGLGEANRALGQNRRAAVYYQRYADSNSRDADPRLQQEARAWAAKLR